MQTTTCEPQAGDQAIQARIDRIRWYHDFDFPGGLRARTETPDKEFHRRLWAFIERNLDPIDFSGKSVLDIGCWDGYWSFYAERRGAASVLATDDISQNWADGTGLQLARSLFRSEIEVNQQLSVYDLASLDRTFDVILCLGVYYHLYDPFYAFSQIRHCCHEGTVVVFEGDVDMALAPGTARYCFGNPSKNAFAPSLSFLGTVLGAAYFEVVRTDYLRPRATTGLRALGRRAKSFVRRLRSRLTGRVKSDLNRIVLTCKPFAGENEQHPYAPHFGLRKYDPRYRG
jgi:tRNA (mo5U34)-methyltransferase